MGAAKRPFGFWVYCAGLVLAASVFVAIGILRDRGVDDHLVAFVAFTVLLAVAERTALSYYDGDVRWGLSPSEACLVPMLFVLSPTQVVIAAVLAMSSIVDEWNDPSKHTFNVAQFGCAAGAAALTFRWIEDPSTAFGLQDAGAAVVAATLFSFLTQSFVGIAIQVAGQGRIADAFGDVRSTIFVGLTSSLVLGLFGAAAYAAAAWMLLLFPPAIAGLYFGYRAVARQSSERRRIERLHNATRALAASSDLATALEGFLLAVADVLSAMGARVIITSRAGIVSSAVYEGDLKETARPLEGTGTESFLHYVKQTRRPLLFGPDQDPVPAALSTGGTRNLLAVPVMEDDEVNGLLIVSDRVGADEFGDDDIKLLDALAADLSLTLQSHRLFEEVTEERERFELLVESVTDYAIYMLDLHGEIVSWNSGAERILGYKSSEILGRHHSTFYPPESHGDWHDQLNEAAVRGRLEAEGHRVRRDGSLFVANEIITPVRSASGELTGFAKVTRDISEWVRTETEKEALQAQLHQVQKLESIGQLAGGVAHDFNNLLSVITNATTFALKALPAGHEAVEDLNDVKAAAVRATELTRQLLIFSRRDLYEPRVLNVNDVVHSTLKLLKRALGERIIVEAKLDDSIGMITADPGQLEQVLMNLAINARDAMPDGGTLTIESSSVIVDEYVARRYVDVLSGRHVRLIVSDTGHGIDAAIAAKVFDPFFTTKPKGSGTGLGLATVYGIVTGVHGHIHMTSTPGQGTTFEILFPVTDAVVEEASRLPAEAPASGNGHAETILLVEDDDSVRNVTQKVLERNGYRVIDAWGSKDALTKFSRTKDDVSLLLTDIVMPDMTGVELAQRVREAKPSLKVVYMSGYSPGVFSNGGADLAGELVQKPFEQDQILAVVRKALDGDVQVKGR